MSFKLAKKCIQIVLVSIASCLSVVSAAENLIPDYFAEPGVNPNRDYVRQNDVETIDPFNGGLRLSHIDLSIPGNGGFDIVVRRNYTNPQDSLGPRNVYGVGWAITFGRVLVHQSASLCGGSNADTLDNPVVELPDGRREVLVRPIGQSYTWVTKDRWKGECLPNSAGMLITSPEGVQYKMDHISMEGGGWSEPVVAWNTTEIMDRHGNTLTINYTSGGAGGEYELISSLASEGRTVNFTYTDQAQDTVRLNTISSTSGQTEPPLIFRTPR